MADMGLYIKFMTVSASHVMPPFFSLLTRNQYFQILVSGSQLNSLNLRLPWYNINVLSRFFKCLSLSSKLNLPLTKRLPTK